MVVKLEFIIDYEVDVIIGVIGIFNVFVDLLSVEYYIMLGLFGDVNLLFDDFDGYDGVIIIKVFLLNILNEIVVVYKLVFVEEV